MSACRIGVLALQGDVREHLAALRTLDVEATAVRRPAELSACDGLVLPGGESTTMIRLARVFGLLDPLRDRISDGLPVFGTCAGMILLADRVTDGAPDQETVGGIDMTVRRNAFGRQVDSFEASLAMTGIEGDLHAVFIRAPAVDDVGPDVEVLARVEAGTPGQDVASRIVAVRQGHLMATSFHPEVGGDARVHQLFVELVRRT